MASLYRSLLPFQLKNQGSKFSAEPRWRMEIDSDSDSDTIMVAARSEGGAAARHEMRPCREAAGIPSSKNGGSTRRRSASIGEQTVMV